MSELLECMCCVCLAAVSLVYPFPVTDESNMDCVQRWLTSSHTHDYHTSLDSPLETHTDTVKWAGLARTAKSKLGDRDGVAKLTDMSVK